VLALTVALTLVSEELLLIAATLAIALLAELAEEKVSSAATEPRIVVPFITKSPLVRVAALPTALAPAEVADPSLSVLTWAISKEMVCPVLAPT